MARVVYITSEATLPGNPAFRRALAQLKDAKLIDDYIIIAPYIRMKRNQNRACVINEIHHFKPTKILIEHPGNKGLNIGEISELKKLKEALDFEIIIHEGDVFGRITKPMSNELKNLARISDKIYTPGSSVQFKLYKKLGAPEVRWAPTVYDQKRFGVLEITDHYDHDVIMIGSNVTSRIPFRSLPGTWRRKQLAKKLSRSFGDNFKLYGSGWPKKFNASALPFDEQEQAISKARISVNFDHFPKEKDFFSNRLGISLASGSTHVTSQHPGYTELFSDDSKQFLFYYQTNKQIVNKIQHLLKNRSDKEFYLAGLKARKYADSNFREDHLLASIIIPEVAKDQINMAYGKLAKMPLQY